MMTQAGGPGTPGARGPASEWYAKGLRFTCTQCGNCCSGPPGTVAFTALIAHRALLVERHLQEAEGRLSGLVLQLLTGVAKLRVAGAEERAFAKWAAHFGRQRLLRFRVGRYQNDVDTFSAVAGVVSTLAIFGFYARIAASPETTITTGQFIAFAAAFGTFMASGLSLAASLMSLLEVIPTMARARPILVTLPEANVSRPDPGQLEGRIDVSHLSFSYDRDGPLILDDVSLSVEPGEFVALVGPSGGGKSTLLRLLLGFEQSETSSIFFDGRDVRTVDVKALRRQIGVVLQSSRLTAGDVFTNIVGATSLTLEDAWEAARMAGLDRDLKAMPMGMHTIVSEGGTNLSGGQRQRLLIARSLVGRPRLVFFDEATSALDNRTQQVISESLEALHATRVVIAHRLSTIRKADRIHVIERGRVSEAGTFEDLIAADGLFAGLAARQTA